MPRELAVDGQADAQPVQPGPLIAIEKSDLLDAAQDPVRRALGPLERARDVANGQLGTIGREQIQHPTQFLQHLSLLHRSGYLIRRHISRRTSEYPPRLARIPRDPSRTGRAQMLR